MYRLFLRTRLIRKGLKYFLWNSDLVHLAFIGYLLSPLRCMFRCSVCSTFCCKFVYSQFESSKWLYVLLLVTDRVVFKKWWQFLLLKFLLFEDLLSFSFAFQTKDRMASFPCFGLVYDLNIAALVQRTYAIELDVALLVLSIVELMSGLLVQFYRCLLVRVVW